MIYDGSITYVLYSLRKQFGFDVVRIKLGGVDCVSKIIIKANSSQKDEIFQEFCNKLQGTRLQRNITIN